MLAGMQVLQSDGNLREVHKGHGCSDLTRTDIFHASA